MKTLDWSVATLAGDFWKELTVEMKATVYLPNSAK
jgi:hypothetical protein